MITAPIVVNHGLFNALIVAKLGAFGSFLNFVTNVEYGRKVWLDFLRSSVRSYRGRALKKLKSDLVGVRITRRRGEPVRGRGSDEE